MINKLQREGVQQDKSDFIEGTYMNYEMKPLTEEEGTFDIADQAGPGCHEGENKNEQY